MGGGLGLVAMLITFRCVSHDNLQKEKLWIIKRLFVTHNMLAVAKLANPVRA